MPSDCFRFKQFTIRQDRCAMKVTTDACIFGAWAPVPEAARRALDIGAGTGLLSLMLAQRFPLLEIDAVEIDEAAAVQAAENVAASPFADRIKVHCADVRQLPSRSYDFIISNPPFFENGLAGPDVLRNTARHAAKLSPGEVVRLAEGSFQPTFGFAVLAPAPFNLPQKCGFAMRRLLAVKSMPQKAAHLHAVVAQKGVQQKTLTAELTVYSTYGVLTKQAAHLLRPFYLKL